MTTRAIGLLARIELNEDDLFEIVEVGPSGGGFFELPGPKVRPVRPHLRLSTGAGRIIGGVVLADGTAVPRIVLVKAGAARVLPLDGPPQALAPRADGGFWMLSASTLTARDENGAVLSRTEVWGHTLVGAEDDGVWVVGAGEAKFVERDGTTGSPAVPFDLRSPVGAGRALYGVSKQLPYRIERVEPDGSSRPIETPTLDHHERLLCVDPGHELVTLSGQRVRRHRIGRETTEYAIQCAGLDDVGQPFTSARVGAEVVVTHSDGTTDRFPAPDASPSTMAFTIIAREGGRSLGYASDLACWFDSDGQVDSSVKVDDAVYRDDVFPHAWHLAPVQGIVSPVPGTFVVSATGPTEMVVLQVSLPS